MGAVNAPEGVLIFTGRRDVRRSIFDALDIDGDLVLLSARDANQLEVLLADAPPLHVAVVGADGSADMAQGLRILRASPAYAGLPIVHVVADEPGVAPDGAATWLREGAIATELAQRVRAAIRAPAASPAPKGPDWRFAFDAGAAWVVASTPDGCIVESGQAMERLCKGDGPVQGRLLSELFVLADGAEWPVPDGEGVPCTLRLRDGTDIVGEVDVRHLVDAGNHRIAVGFRDLRAMDTAARALALLAVLDACPSDDEGMAEAAAMLADALDLDIVAVWSAFPESETGPEVLARIWNGTGTVAWPEAADLPLLKICLGGEALSHLGDESGLPMGDPLVDVLGLTSYAWLPLLDERRCVLGALFTGRRRRSGDAAVLAPALRAAAARFASALELRRTREQGRERGLIDQLTGLPNRLLFNDRLDTTIREAERTGECFATLLVDLDRFKSINDTLGHSVGDQVLMAVARRLRASVRASDTVARYAGDEFTMTLRHIIKRDDVLRIAEKVVQAMEIPLSLDDGSELQVTVSVGISFFPDDAVEGELLLRHADEAMYGAKSLGRNNYQVYAANVDTAQQQQAELKARLRHAVRNDELRVYYQPQVEAMSEDIVGMEALVRWEHPELGMISPAFFIPLAEASGLIVPIGEWVLRTACAQAKIWQDRYGLGLRLGVNLSAVQLMQPNLAAVVASALRDTALEASQLELEVTESISVKTVPHLVETLDALHAMGCRIAIDDFGTGAASLDYLRRLPADRIKIDQSFVRNIGVDPDDEAIVRATIDMAHRLKRGVVAEGVEIEQHLHFLRANGCDELQGYLFCRPLPTPAFDKLLAERERVVSEGQAVPA
ncbi:diguanylate cyclase (GGDEF) domain-containing protein [Luteibacter sp. UNCMF331Sha3.1]|uniref:putative bifunctional diguanylate cyclase/phosphodiesterase n=1 Tax=Luteibacter sp. UNCMF331Sha3.1 TaxID=1502760 RepID=UPI0008C66408|nr:bifunctional diguanylate cyclase/phosphodiesterase [Luteibacter sp. UNCMF331Sha3.1]SEN34209.1 diguanylate cyclase (GGDEF) domain-containing protein [Luteibacter sp. UNCMF331Sha3.1]